MIRLLIAATFLLTGCITIYANDAASQQRDCACPVDAGAQIDWHGIYFYPWPDPVYQYDAGYWYITQ